MIKRDFVPLNNRAGYSLSEGLPEPTDPLPATTESLKPVFSGQPAVCVHAPDEGLFENFEQAAALPDPQTGQDARPL